MALLGLVVVAEAIRKSVPGIVPQATWMGAVGFTALAANTACFAMLHRHRGHDLNMRSAWLCSRNDLIASTSVLGAAGLVALTGQAVAGRAGGRGHRAAVPAFRATGGLGSLERLAASRSSTRSRCPLTMAANSNMSRRRPILLLLLMAALIASPIPSAEVHHTCDAPETLAEVSAGTSGMSGAIPTTDGEHLHLDQCCQHAQVEAPVALEVRTTTHKHPPERLRQEVLPGTSRPPYRPPIA